ncbi:MAG: iron-containing alcohol dehydrogenase, partial [Erysipelotrichaceae bacterium]
ITAVITDEKTKHKYTINSFPLMPDVALLDARATFTLPQSVTAGCGMDVLCHAVEAYIGNSTTAFTRKCALEASKMVFDNLLIAYHEPQNYEARKNMLIASYKAGVAFSRSYVGYIHAIAQSLGGEYGIAHGRANAIIMPMILRGYGNCIYNKIKQMAVYCEIADENTSEEETFEIFVSRIENMIKEMNIEDIKVVEEKDIDKLINYAYKEATPLYPVPRFMDKEELSGYYMRMMEDEN